MSAIIALAIGFSGGYFLGSNKPPAPTTHVMAHATMANTMAGMVEKDICY